ncbi:cytosolic carboxypeptidase 3 [Clonorchis sinensis]|uniref:Cytosolic carboxypeptidase 3 n=1 Tax=Clonorchis sinensis TaxID=79923 RepID=G7Y7X4_CLOSI|nr:cytosolic carboxypeptidase 3 [Clonorchis sinensis]
MMLSSWNSCSITGHDLNRNYRKPQKDVFPTIWHTRELVRQCKLKHMDVIYYDLHGHSRRNNVFTYGCDQSLRKAPNNTDTVNPVTLLQDRVLPFLLSKLLPDKFSLTACRFNIQRQKESTSRVVFWREFELTHSFTLETTFNGSNLMRREVKQFDVTDFMDVGRSIGPCLLEFHRLYAKPSLMRAMIARIARTFLVHLLQEGQSTDAQSDDIDASNQSVSIRTKKCSKNAKEENPNF